MRFCLQDCASVQAFSCYDGGEMNLIRGNVAVILYVANWLIFPQALLIES